MDINNKKEFEQRTKELVSKLTLDEKISMLTGGHMPVERLGMKEYHIGAEVARGFVGRSADRVSTVFPQPVGLASTFDKDLMYSLGEIAADEARAYYNINQKGGIALWGPTVDMARDPRWGRNEEAYGEDVCLTGELSAQYTKGMAGDNGRFLKSIPTLKHFCANNNEEDRGSCDAYLPLRLKYDYYYAAFENAIVNGGAKSLMTAYNEINGCPAILNPEIKSILKDKWGLWYTVSDGGDFSQTVVSHRFCDTHSESIALTIKAGSDSMTDNGILVKDAARKAIEEGRLTEADIDETLCNTIFSRFALGQFDECEYNTIGLDVIDCDDHKKTNLKATLKQITLLKNNGILPLKSAPQKLAVLGAMADENLMDWYTGVSSYDISVLEGIKEEFKTSEVIHDSLWDHVSIKAPNGKYLSVNEDGLLTAAAETVGESEIFELQDWGENWINFFSAKYKKYIKLSDGDVFRLNSRRVYDWYTRETVNLKRFGDKYLIEEFLHHRRMFCDDNGNISVKSINNALSDQLFEINVVKSGRERASEIAKAADFVLYCVGNHPVQVAKECYDRKTLALNIQPGMATHLVNQNKNTVMAIISSYPYSVNEENAVLPAIIYSSHAGMFLGTAVAKTLSGENNPAGRTPQTWYKSEYELPDILNYDIETSGTTYMYFKGDALYPFGHGLSYSKFEYKDFNINVTDNEIWADVTVKNISDRDGEEVVQIYYTVTDSKVIRPIKKLCGFARVNIKAGEEEKIRVDISRRMLEIFNVRNRKNILESGEYKFMAAASSADVRLEKTLLLSGEELGKRPCEFDAETYDYSKEMRILYSKNAGHYIKGTGWSPVAGYDGIDFAGKKTLTVYAASANGRARITVDLGAKGKTDIMIEAGNSLDDFRPYTINIPEGKANAFTVYSSENATIQKYVIK
ncbi:MAG: glycoside hydrolase family 3 C-terminal domain-containing protein [Oscillospiraceae bacterium]|nr:glycoside hydrolase family 3 C-terminal domain-containing protein [Oscillospiraceae bacterium]